MAATCDDFGQEQVAPNMSSLNSWMHHEAVAAPAPTAADSAKLRQDLPGIVAKMVVGSVRDGWPTAGAEPMSRHHALPGDWKSSGACGGYGLLMDISDPSHPVRLSAAAIPTSRTAFGELQQRRKQDPLLR